MMKVEEFKHSHGSGKQTKKAKVIEEANRRQKPWTITGRDDKHEINCLFSFVLI